MKYYWGPIIGAFALGGVNTMYGSWPDRPSGSLASMERQCVSKFTGAGYARAQTKQACSCLVNKAKNWRAVNPDSEYTKDVHMKFGATCINRSGLNSARQRGNVLPGINAPPSDWGGDGFAEEGAWDGE